MQSPMIQACRANAASGNQPSSPAWVWYLDPRDHCLMPPSVRRPGLLRPAEPGRLDAVLVVVPACQAQQFRLRLPCFPNNSCS